MTHIIIFFTWKNGMQFKKSSHTENTIVLIQNKMAFIFLYSQEIDKILLYDYFDTIHVNSAAYWIVVEHDGATFSVALGTEVVFPFPVPRKNLLYRNYCSTKQITRLMSHIDKLLKYVSCLRLTRNPSFQMLYLTGASGGLLHYCSAQKYNFGQ